VHLFDLACSHEAIDDAKHGRFVTSKDPSDELIGHTLLNDEAHSNMTLVCGRLC
jgi:hypothetical protein